MGGVDLAQRDLFLRPQNGSVARMGRAQGAEGPSLPRMKVEG